MGTLLMDEAEDMRASCYPELAADVLQNRYRIIGGIARYLFARNLSGAEDDGVDSAVEEVEEMHESNNVMTL